MLTTVESDVWSSSYSRWPRHTCHVCQSRFKSVPQPFDSPSVFPTLDHLFNKVKKTSKRTRTVSLPKRLKQCAMEEVLVAKGLVFFHSWKTSKLRTWSHCWNVNYQRTTQTPKSPGSCSSLKLLQFWIRLLYFSPTRYVWFWKHCGCPYQCRLNQFLSPRVSE